jgi:hypothetical protein
MMEIKVSKDQVLPRLGQSCVKQNDWRVIVGRPETPWRLAVKVIDAKRYVVY